MKRYILLGISFILLLGLVALAVMPEPNQPAAEMLFTKVDSLQNLTEIT